MGKAVRGTQVAHRQCETCPFFSTPQTMRAACVQLDNHNNQNESLRGHPIHVLRALTYTLGVVITM